jgi:hypothetical protein
VDKTTRAVLTVILTVFGLAFMVLGVIEFAARQHHVLGVIHVATGVLWLLGVVLIRRRAPRV